MFKRTSLLTDGLIALAVFAVLALLPIFIPSKGFADFIIRLAAWGIFATSLNMLVGYTGMESFGHGLFFGLGCYSYGLMMRYFGVSIPVAFLATIAIAVVVAFIVGAICVRLNEIYFAFITLAFQMLLHSLIIAWSPVTGGDNGLTGIPRPPFLGFRLDNQYNLYLLCAGLLVVSLLVMHHIVRSPFGTTMRMIRDNAARAPFLGISVFWARLKIFIIAGVFGAIGGVVMCLFAGGAFPDYAYWSISGEAIFMIMLGGISVFLGPMLGAVMLLLLNDATTKFTSHYGLVLGTVILLFALGLRKGLLDFIVERWQRRNAVAAAGKPEGTPASRVATPAAGE
ncbi:MAG: branched-chain amino acid ABC transporter permease [Proteobacteria bacterium]|nr:branched-chain amino acid ABC transporter permease [Pseudomonadota bacterium]